MCLIVFSYKQHGDYPLIFAANRDEYYERPTREATFWDEHPNILAGKDLQAGGTWMGINTKGELSALTNYRDPSIQRTNPPSRGRLVLDFLKSEVDAPRYLREVDKQAQQYMGFNLLAGDLNRLAYYSNQHGKIQLLDSGLYGLSNHLLDTPWPKVQWAKEGLKNIIQKQSVSEEALFSLLASDRKASEEELPDTGIPKDIEKQVSPIFIKGEQYGTRCSTILLVDSEGEATFVERCFEPGTAEVRNQNRYTFTVDRS